MSAPLELDPASPLLFIINAASGSSDADTKRELIEATLQAAGRKGKLLFSPPDGLARLAQEAASKAIASRTAVVAVGGDGTINTVAQAAHAAGCAMGVVPQGTFNYFARTHGIPDDPVEAVRLLFHGAPAPVRVAAIHDRVFLVNASLGLYPALLEDREAYKARFGRSRWVAFWAASATLLRAQRQLRLQIEDGTGKRSVRTLTLFVGNNHLQLKQLGLGQPTLAESAQIHGPEENRITAVILRPIGTMSMIRLMLHGAMGTLGEAQSVEHFKFEHMVVRPTLPSGRRGVKVAFDGEVTRMHAPLEFRVLAKPLYLIKPRHQDDMAPSPNDPAAATEGPAA